MDINCVSGCEYQIEGKCGLTELPSVARFSMNTASSGGNSGDVYSSIISNVGNGCPYFLEKKRGKPIEFI